MLGSTNKVANTPMHILFKCIHKLQRHRSQSYKVQELNLRVEMKRVQGPDHLSVNVRKIIQAIPVHFFLCGFSGLSHKNRD